MTAPNHRWRNFKNAFMQTLTFACAILVVMPLVLVFYHLIKQGFSSINLAFFTQLPKPVGETGGGMANAIVGTFILLAQAAVYRRAGRRARRRFSFRIRRNKIELVRSVSPRTF